MPRATTRKAKTKAKRKPRARARAAKPRGRRRRPSGPAASPPPPAPAIDAVTSVRALAALVGRNESTVRKWRRRPAWSFGGPPWTPAQVAAIQAWAGALQADRAARPPAPASEAADALPFDQTAAGKRQAVDLQLQLEKALTAQIHRQRLEGALHDVAECRTRRLRQIQAVKSRMLDLERLAPTVAEKPADDIAPILREFGLETLRTFANGEGEESEGAGQGATG